MQVYSCQRRLSKEFDKAFGLPGARGQAFKILCRQNHNGFFVVTSDPLRSFLPSLAEQLAEAGLGRLQLPRRRLWPVCSFAWWSFPHGYQLTKILTSLTSI
jgi:hypothetical protein